MYLPDSRFKKAEGTTYTRGASSRGNVSDRTDHSNDILARLQRIETAITGLANHVYGGVIVRDIIEALGNNKNILSKRLKGSGSKSKGGKKGTRPLNAFMIFNKEQRPIVKEELKKKYPTFVKVNSKGEEQISIPIIDPNTNAPRRDKNGKEIKWNVTKELGFRWKNLTEEQKAVYKKLAKEKKAEYNAKQGTATEEEAKKEVVERPNLPDVTSTGVVQTNEIVGKDEAPTVEPTKVSDRLKNLLKGK